MSELRKELASAINSCSAENASNTPDFLLAEFLAGCLDSFDKTIAAREKWYGREHSSISLWNSEPLPPSGDVAAPSPKPVGE